MRYLIGTLLASLVLVVAGCGGDDEETASGGGNAADRAFLEGMIPHHDGGVDLGKLAAEMSEHEELKELGQDVDEAQSREVEEMKEAHERLFGEPFPEGEHGGDDSLAELEAADPFDKAFIDELIPHHQEAITMAREEIAGGSDDELKELAENIVETQSKEIEDMNDWREDWYGAPSPAGGVPAE
ncbi:MAG: DUF305 domain-containing protein [Gaiellaceae bacterium MAG52_C11]|nr:DUF305 domain-containing protein [Candidatus Gaiellasilicea maunaloa]